MVAIMPNRIDTISGFGCLESAVASAVRQGLRSLDRVATAFLTALYESRRRQAERQLLAGLDDRMLKDLGLNRCDVELEIRKRFWQE